MMFSWWRMSLFHNRRDKKVASYGETRFPLRQKVERVFCRELEHVQRRVEKV